MPLDSPDDLPLWWREFYDEREAILWCEGLSDQDAADLAWRITLRSYMRSLAR